MVVKRIDALHYYFILVFLSENLMLFRELQMNWSFGVNIFSSLISHAFCFLECLLMLLGGGVDFV